MEISQLISVSAITITQARWLQAHIHLAASHLSEYELVITSPSATNC